MEEIGFLFLTIIIELPIALFIMPNVFWKRACWIVLCVNMITHPIAWLLSVHGIPWIMIESGIIIFEVVVFTLLFSDTRKRAILSAILMNACSAGIGAIFF